MRSAIWIAAALGALTLGCHRHHYERFEFCIVGSHGGGTVSQDEIRIQQGKVVTLKVLPINCEDDIMKKETGVSLATDNPAVLGIDRLDLETNPCEGPPRWYYVLYGVDAGQTVLRISVNGSEREEIPVHITPP